MKKKYNRIFVFIVILLLVCVICTEVSYSKGIKDKLKNRKIRFYYLFKEIREKYFYEFYEINKRCLSDDDCRALEFCKFEEGKIIGKCTRRAVDPPMPRNVF